MKKKIIWGLGYPVINKDPEYNHLVSWSNPHITYDISLKSVTDNFLCLRLKNKTSQTSEWHNGHIHPFHTVCAFDEPDFCSYHCSRTSAWFLGVSEDVKLQSSPVQFSFSSVLLFSPSLEHNLGSEVLLLDGVVAYAHLQHPLGLHHLYILHVFLFLIEGTVT